MWKRDHPEFLVSIKKGKTVAGANVESRQCGRACSGGGHAFGRSGVARTAAIDRCKNRQVIPWILGHPLPQRLACQVAGFTVYPFR